MVTFNILFMNSIDPDNEVRVLGNEMTCNLDKTNEEPVLQCKIIKSQTGVFGHTQKVSLQPKLPKLCSDTVADHSFYMDTSLFYGHIIVIIADG